MLSWGQGLSGLLCHYDAYTGFFSALPVAAMTHPRNVKPSKQSCEYYCVHLKWPRTLLALCLPSWDSHLCLCPHTHYLLRHASKSSYPVPLSDPPPTEHLAHSWRKQLSFCSRLTQGVRGGSFSALFRNKQQGDGSVFFVKFPCEPAFRNS